MQYIMFTCENDVDIVPENVLVLFAAHTAVLALLEEVILDVRRLAPV